MKQFSQGPLLLAAVTGCSFGGNTSSTATTTGKSISRRSFSNNVWRNSSSASMMRQPRSTIALTSSLSPVDPRTTAPSGFSATTTITATVTQRRFNASFLMSNTKTPIMPFRGYVSDGISMRPSHRCGGGRGVFAERMLNYDVQLMKIDAFNYHVSQEPYQMQSRQMLRHVISQFALGNKLEREWMRKHIFMMTVGGAPAFETEEDCQRFIHRCPGGPKLMIEGQIDTEEIQKLAMQVEYNRWPIEYGGEKGVALIPEASLFNHSCEANAAVEIRMDPVTKQFSASVRTLRPVKAGEEIYLNYMPEGLDMPLTRFVQKLKHRWGFECRCGICKTRTIAMCVVFLVAFMGPVLVPFLLAITDRIKKKHNY